MMEELQVVVKFVKDHPIPLITLAVGFLIEDYLKRKKGDE